MNSSASLASRALLAVLLMVGFYILAVAVAAGLLYIPYAEMTYAHRLHFKLAAGCVICALAILWSVLPRADKFEAPGPQLTRDQHPELFGELEGVANSVQQAMPVEVYLVPDVNAWVMQRGGTMGFGSQRVMGLGLPLMRMLTRSQFRAVLAHEFGHYHGGDTRLGPWIYKTRGTIGRTLGSLGEGSWLQLPFLWYGKMFLRITHAISRRQEFVADELAARTIGSQPLINGLRTIHGVGPAYQAYWFNVCAPVLNAGYRPPLTEGFQRFIQAASVAESIQKQLEEELNTGQTNPYDTHPPLKERIAAVAQLPTGDPGPEDPPATTLLGDVAALESHLLSVLADPEKAKQLQPLDWEEVASRVYLPHWTKLIQVNVAALAGITPLAFAAWAADQKAASLLLRYPDGESPDEEHAEELTRNVAGAALCMLLVNRGARLVSGPGQPVSLTMASASMEPFRIISALAAGTLTEANWQSQCRELGIAESDLGQLLPPVATEKPA